MKILFLCQWFPPEFAPIGVMLKELGEDLSRLGHKVTVVTGFPNHPYGVVFKGYRKKLFWRESWGRLEIIRTFLYTSPKKNLISRLLNFLTFTLSSAISLLFLPKQDCLFIVSPPLTLGVVGIFIRIIKGSPYILDVQDIYPDAAISMGIVRSRIIISFLKFLEKFVYRYAKYIGVISEGFYDNIRQKGIDSKKIEVIPNWIDINEIVPLPRLNDFSKENELNNKYTVLYSGTIGVISGAEIMLEVAQLMRKYSDILFLFVGEGNAKDKIEKNASDRELKNMKFLPFQPREKLSSVQSSSNVSVITLHPGMGLSSVPSKVLGYMAAARPILASVDKNSDTAKLIRKARCGKIVKPGDCEEIAKGILYFRNNPEVCKIYGRNGREFLEKNLSRKYITEKYERLFLKSVS